MLPHLILSGLVPVILIHETPHVHKNRKHLDHLPGLVRKLISRFCFLGSDTEYNYLNDVKVLFQFFYFRSQARAVERKVRLGLGISSESESEF